MSGEDPILHAQQAYYEARAAEYDEWWLRRGRYDRGPALNQTWFEEAAEVTDALRTFSPRGAVLELACGTGLWTQRLAKTADRLTAVDGSPAMLALNAARLKDARVRYVQADLFTWKPDARYDVVFFSFWLSHVPENRFVAFWDLVRRALAPGGRVFLVDSRREAGSQALDHRLPAPDAEVMTRKLNDGRQFEIYKRFYAPGDLEARLTALGWRAEARETARFFLHATATRVA
ncbi:MAG: methyltransferase domain-containing protein [Thermoflexales bacterium]|nr:methyltransferase domain-containing protein [Thermoflexales bacterium]